MYQTSSPADLMAMFGISGPAPNLRERWNAAPTQDLAVVRFNPEIRERSLDALRWGLVPVWAKDIGFGTRCINARDLSEDGGKAVHQMPAFRGAFAKRRCIVPANGFYEWKKLDPKGKTKQPHAIARRDRAPMAFAGLWEAWRAEGTEEWIRTFTVITTSANELMAPIHNRMPVILDPADWSRWLGEEAANQDELLALLRPHPVEVMEAWAIGSAVGNVRSDGPGLIEPVSLAG